jgi:hypothetical protein
MTANFGADILQPASAKVSGGLTSVGAFCFP